MAEFLDGNDWQTILTDLLLPTQLVREGNLDHTDVYRCICSEHIAAGQVIALKNNTICLATSQDGVVTGVAVATAFAGEQCEYVTRGLVSEESWVAATGSQRLVFGRNYFLVGQGQLSLMPSQTGYIIPIGQAQSHFMLDVNLGQKVKL